MRHVRASGRLVTALVISTILVGHSYRRPRYMVVSSSSAAEDALIQSSKRLRSACLSPMTDNLLWAHRTLRRSNSCCPTSLISFKRFAVSQTWKKHGDNVYGCWRHWDGVHDHRPRRPLVVQLPRVEVYGWATQRTDLQAHCTSGVKFKPNPLHVIHEET